MLAWEVGGWRWLPCVTCLARRLTCEEVVGKDFASQFQKIEGGNLFVSLFHLQKPDQARPYNRPHGFES